MQKLRLDLDMGSNLRYLRTCHGFTQERLVAHLNLMGINISRAIYSRYETCELNVPVSVIVALHSVYKCTYDEFFVNLNEEDESVTG